MTMTSTKNVVVHFYRTPGESAAKVQRKASKLGFEIASIRTEYCYNVELAPGLSALSAEQQAKLAWLLTETFEPDNFASTPFLTSGSGSGSGPVVEVGPRLAFSTAFSSNSISMCAACGITEVTRIERSRRYLLTTKSPLTESQVGAFASLVHDRMTEAVYHTQLTSFENNARAEPTKTVPVLKEGRAVLEKMNAVKGLGFDDWDLDFYTKMFTETLKRDPTEVELFDLGQSNSEHSRHWFFGGKMIIDGVEKPQTLFQMVKATLPKESNSIIAFHDNSSAIQGFEVEQLVSTDPTKSAPMGISNHTLHPILTAETHNFPSGVAPFPGAETGTGGRLRDVQATGRGAHSLAGVSAYCVGNLRIPGYELPWESESKGDAYPSNLALPLDIEVESSNGASDYGNKYGEPVVQGFTRSFGQRLPNGERREWLKPIMFTAGIGQMDGRHAVKGEPEVGMVVCKLGGPAYRIGMGGGAASSRVQGTADASLDFDAVQRGDAEMENRLNRVIRGCVEMGDDNPIVSIHDQGAGGNGNVLKEIVEPMGARYEIRKLPVGDPTLSVLEIWGAEYQENDAILVKPQYLERVLALGERENCPVSAVGVVTGDGRVTVVDEDGSIPFDLPLSLVLGKMPQKTFTFDTPKRILKPLSLPEGTTVASALDRVLRLLDVGSKRFLTNKVDRSVTGLIAQQQCVGPLQTPLANCAVLAQTHFSNTGMAVSVGEQPIKGLIDSAAQARMTAGEALTNLMWAKITKLQDVKASGNWMWAAKMEGEGAMMWEACEALRDALLDLGVGIDGGKDSLSMAAKAGGETVKCPGEVTLTCYAAVTDIRKTVTPDLKYPNAGKLLYVDLSGGNNRLGGTALSTVYAQLGDVPPNVADFGPLRSCFDCVQQLIEAGLIASGHDRSDGGLIVTLCEMAFAGNCGIKVQVPAADDAIAAMFNEELGIVLEVLPQNADRVKQHFTACGLAALEIGHVTSEKTIEIRVGDSVVLNASTPALRDVWESTSYELERLQCDVACAEAEKAQLLVRDGPTYVTTFPMPQLDLSITRTHKMAVIRQEGSNGDREMCAAFHAAGFEVWDVNMRDLVAGSVTLDAFRGIAFCGGFSYADVNDSAKGWAGVIKFNPSLLAQFEAFRDRPNTFSLGVCNGCQLMALLGWVPFDSAAVPYTTQPRLVHNDSGRFESRWSTVQVQPSPAVMLQGMEGSSLGVWVAHGEGKVHFPDEAHMQAVQDGGLAPLRYVDDSNAVTMAYPMNPNGSPAGMAALCSKDGRHLAMMPHPERCFLPWQLPHAPADMKVLEGSAAPWLRLFHNAKTFCDNTK